jgi:hypothetical protein
MSLRTTLSETLATLSTYDMSVKVYGEVGCDVDVDWSKVK